ncbi:hypothetical protein OSTOST_03274, partial [Ostertagia ostertagi]
ALHDPRDRGRAGRRERGPGGLQQLRALLRRHGRAVHPDERRGAGHGPAADAPPGPVEAPARRAAVPGAAAGQPHRGRRADLDDRLRRDLRGGDRGLRRAGARQPGSAFVLVLGLLLAADGQLRPARRRAGPHAGSHARPGHPRDAANGHARRRLGAGVHLPGMAADRVAGRAHALGRGCAGCDDLARPALQRGAAAERRHARFHGGVRPDRRVALPLGGPARAAGVAGAAGVDAGAVTPDGEPDAQGARSRRGAQARPRRHRGAGPRGAAARLGRRLRAQFAQLAVVQRLAEGRADQHLHAGDRVAVLVVPVLAHGGLHADDAHARVVLALGEPGAGQRRPELVDQRAVLGDGRVAAQVQEAGMLRRLEVQLHMRIGGDLRVLVAVLVAQEPDRAVLVAGAHAHRANATVRDEEAGVGLVDDLLDLLGRTGAGEVAAQIVDVAVGMGGGQVLAGGIHQRGAHGGLREKVDGSTVGPPPGCACRPRCRCGLSGWRSASAAGAVRAACRPPPASRRRPGCDARGRSASRAAPCR